MTQMDDMEVDPVLEQFLSFIACDIAPHPGPLRSMDPELLDRIQVLIGGVEIDLEAPLSIDDE
jgi:antitoxin PrlF